MCRSSCCDGGGSVLYCYREPCIESLFQGWFGCVLLDGRLSDQRNTHCFGGVWSGGCLWCLIESHVLSQYFTNGLDVVVAVVYYREPCIESVFH